VHAPDACGIQVAKGNKVAPASVIAYSSISIVCEKFAAAEPLLTRGLGKGPSPFVLRRARVADCNHLSSCSNQSLQQMKLYSIMKALRCAKQLLEIISWRSEKVAAQ
jgi:hypothetical protein